MARNLVGRACDTLDVCSGGKGLQLRSREDEDDAVVVVQPNKAIVVYGSFWDAVVHLGNYRKKARRAESPFNKINDHDGNK
jgi:hypothetical protein